MRDLPASQTAATASGMRHEPAAPLQVPTFRQAQPITAEVRENKLLRAQHEVAQRPAPVFEEPTVEAQPEAYAAPAPQAFCTASRAHQRARPPSHARCLSPWSRQARDQRTKKPKPTTSHCTDDEPQRARQPSRPSVWTSRAVGSQRAPAPMTSMRLNCARVRIESGFDRFGRWPAGTP